MESSGQGKNRIKYATSLDFNLVHKLRILAAEQDKKANDLLEEAIVLLLEKYKKL